MTSPDTYHADPSLKGKVRRRLVRLVERRPARVKLDRAMVSFSFDDAPATALTYGAKTLEQRGLRGTYFISAGLAGQDSVMGRYGDRDEIVAVAEAGHEIACHTYSHLDCAATDEAAIQADIERNVATLNAWGAPQPSTFAYPYGDVSLGSKRMMAKRYGVSRALHKGLIQTGTDLNQAPAVGIEGPAGGIVCRRWLQYAVQNKAWVIFYTHDIRDEPSDVGCTPRAFRELVDSARTFNCDIVTVAEGARRVSGAR